MKPGIHPTWYPDSVVTCACGNSWTTGSTKKEIHTDVCNKCHPFFTGEQRIVDTAGQVERFMKRINAKEQIAATQPASEDKKAKKEKRRDRKAGTTVSIQPVPAAPEDLPLAVAADQVVAEPAPAVAEPVSKVEPMKFAEPVAVVEEPAPVAKVEEPAPVVEAKVEEVAPAMQAEEPAPVAAIEEPVAVVEVPTPVAEVEETTPVAVVEESTVAQAEAPAPAAVVAEPAPTAQVDQIPSMAEAPVEQVEEKSKAKPRAKPATKKPAAKKAAPAKSKASPVKKAKK